MKFSGLLGHLPILGPFDLCQGRGAWGQRAQLELGVSSSFMTSGGSRGCPYTRATKRAPAAWRPHPQRSEVAWPLSHSNLGQDKRPKLWLPDCLLTMLRAFWTLV